MIEKNYSFVDHENNDVNLDNLDVMLFNMHQSTICFVRNKRHLHFKMSPTKEVVRHLNFIRDELNFQTLGKIISKIHGLDGNSDFRKKYYQWSFTKGAGITSEIKEGDLISFDNSKSLLTIHSPWSDKNKLEMKIAFIISETDLYEIVCLIGTFFNCVIRKVETSRKELFVFKMIPF